MFHFPRTCRIQLTRRQRNARTQGTVAKKTRLNAEKKEPEMKNFGLASLTVSQAAVCIESNDPTLAK
jgi:hypothetical protein